MLFCSLLNECQPSYPYTEFLIIIKADRSAVVGPTKGNNSQTPYTGGKKL